MASTDSVAWIPDELLRNGAAVAGLMVHDVHDARNVLRAFAKRTSNDLFRERLIGAYVISQDPALRAKMKWK